MDGITAPEISIVVPVRNGANFLRQALESALAQDHPSYEIIVGINPSDDSTLELSQEILGKKYPGIIAFKDEVNMPQNFNRTVARARGKYIKFLSHDDILKPFSLNALVSEFYKKANLVLATSYESFLPSSQPSRREAALGKHHYLGKYRSLYRFSKYGNWLGGPSGVMVKTEIFRNIMFDEDLPCAFDLNCWIEMSRRGRIAIVPKELYSTRIHAHQGTRSCNQGGFTKDLNKIRYKHMHSSDLLIRAIFQFAR